MTDNYVDGDDGDDNGDRGGQSVQKQMYLHNSVLSNLHISY